MVLTVALFIVTVSFSVLMMTQALDRQAVEQSAAQASNLQTTLLSKIRMITLDYAKWDAAVAAMQTADGVWLYDNVGSAAVMGRAIQLVVLSGGSLPAAAGWEAKGPRGPVSDLLSPDVLKMVEGRLAAMPAGDGDGIEFFGWHEGVPYAFGTARFEPVEEQLRWPGPLGAYGQLVMGYRLSNDVVSHLAGGSALKDLRIVRERPSSNPFVTLEGLEGSLVGYLTWEQPRPGTTMLKKMLPLLLVVTIAGTCLAAWSIRLLRRNAKSLVQAEHRAFESARNDTLTALPNRAAFNEEIARTARAGHRAVVFLDINDFKRVNDRLGHTAGDELIVAIARRLRPLCPKNCLLARIAGDEFVLVISASDAGRRVAALVAAVDAAFALPFEVVGRQLTAKAAVGYALQTLDDMTGHELVRQADLAMYEAKRRRQGPVAFYEKLDSAEREHNEIEDGLRSALARTEEFSVVYQPIATPDGRLRRAEALARWTSPMLGSVPPDRFIGVAEQTGLIHELGRVLIRQVCFDLARCPSLEVSLNISTHQLMSPSFVAELTAEVTSHSIEPRRIEVELTESVLVENSRTAFQNLRELQAAGFSTALDDFGTGYSSLAYLQQLSFETLKIDRSFAADLRTSPKRRALISSMIDMAHRLDLSVVCEGIETAEDLCLLKDLNCDLMQGYFLDKPLALDALTKRWLVRSEAPVAA